MSYVNLYKPPVKESILNDYGPDPYDINFAFPLPVETMRTSRVQLVPFVPALHAELFTERTAGHDVAQYMPIDLNMPFFLGLIERLIRRDPSSVLFAILDTSGAHPPDTGLGGGALAGVIGVFQVSRENATAEIGPIIVFPSFRGLHLSTHAVAVLLRYGLELPAQGGLGLRRVQWIANKYNVASVRAAQRAGLHVEGTLRWSRALRPGEQGMPPRDGDPLSAHGRDSVMLAMCWDDWEEGGRDKLEAFVGERETGI